MILNKYSLIYLFWTKILMNNICRFKNKFHNKKKKLLMKKFQYNLIQFRKVV